MIVSDRSEQHPISLDLALQRNCSALQRTLQALSGNSLIIYFKSPMTTMAKLIALHNALLDFIFSLYLLLCSNFLNNGHALKTQSVLK